MVEVVIAFVVLLIVLVPVASVLANSITQAASSRERLTALSLAEQYLELLNNTPFGAGHVNQTPTVTALPKMGVELLQKTGTVRSSVAYSIYAEFSWASGAGAPDLCTSGSTPKVIDVQVTVRWSNTTGHITDTTVINYPPAGLETYGFLAVQVNGDPVNGPPDDSGGQRWASRVQSVPVTVHSLPGTTPTTSKTVYPNSYGCAFEQVPPGSYVVALADPSPGTPGGTSFGAPDTPAWVANANEKTAVTQTTLTVNAGQVTESTFQYDEGSVVTLHYPSTTATDGLVTCPAAGSILCLVTGQAPATIGRPASTPVAELSVRTSSGWTVTRPGMARIAATACAGTTRCLAVGYGLSHTTGAAYADSVSSATGSTPNFIQDAVPGAVTTFDSITCPKAGGTTCYAVGTGSSGPVLLSAAVTGTGVTWALDTVPTGLSGVSSISCPGATTCFATATAATGPMILSLSTGSSWVADTLPPTPATTGLIQVACPGTTTCYAVGSTSGGAEILSLSTGTTWVGDTLPAGVTVPTLAQVACPGATECYAIGSQRSGTTISGAVLSLTAPTTWVLDSAPATARLSSLTCPTTTVCVAAGSTTTAPILLSRTGATTWTAGGFALSAGTTLDSVSAVGCSPGGHCDAIGTATTTGTTGAVILSLSATTWTENTLTSAKAPVYLTGVACGPSACAAPGATETGALYLDGTVSGTGWTSATPSGVVQGMYVADAPIAVSDPNLQTASTLVVAVPATPATDLAQIGPLFPFAAGYSVAAGVCSTELTTASATVATTPGATVGATLPLGLLPVQVVTPAGVPVPGATVTAAVNDPNCVPLSPLSGGSDPASYSLGTTGPLGLCAIAVIYDTFTVTVQAPGGYTATAVVEVTPTATVVGGVTQPLPSPVVVKVT